MVGGIVPTNAAADFIAIHAWHHQIEEDQSDIGAGFDDIQSVAARTGGDDLLVAFIAQQFFEQFAVIENIVHDKDRRAQGFLQGSGPDKFLGMNGCAHILREWKRNEPSPRPSPIRWERENIRQSCGVCCGFISSWRYWANTS